MTGEGVFHVPVGPVHAGIIEPGHFRFGVAGEPVLYLQLRLFYVHKGTEKRFERLPWRHGIFLAESISGDTAVGHALAFAHAIERLAGCEPPPRARYLRVVLLELERIYNHVADIGAIATDVAFTVPAAHAQLLRERLVSLQERLFGSRLLRGTVAVGGVKTDLSAAGRRGAAGPPRPAEVRLRVARDPAHRLRQLHGPGRRHGGPAHGRRPGTSASSGSPRGPPASTRTCAATTRTTPTTRCASRCRSRRAATCAPASWCGRGRWSSRSRSSQQALGALPDSPLRTRAPGRSCPPPPRPWAGPRGGAARACTGWRPTPTARSTRVKVTDPSFRNWPGLAHAVPGNIIPDFPVINKSFNLSYSGNDR